ncbi:unnamed protein product, partial [Medioppia subpectinata]
DSPPPKGRPARGRGRGRGRPPGRPAKKGAKKKNDKTTKKQAIDDKKSSAKSLDTDLTDDTKRRHQVSADTLLNVKSESIEFDENLASDLVVSAPSMTPFVSPSAKPLHRNEALNWKYRVNLIGEKVVNPRIHCCDKCLLPILVYGRMIPCKHVFCLSCAKQYESLCPRCGDKVLRVEKSGLGTVFMCQTDSCKRTYLSQRDLQAHIQHRHMRRPPAGTAQAVALNASNISNVIIPAPVMKEVANAPSSVVITGSRLSSYQNSSFQSPIPVVSSRGSNLITVPIQDEVSSGGLNPHSPSITGQSSSLLLSPQQPVSTYVSQQPYGHHNLQWPSVSPNSTFNTYRAPAPTQWPPINPYGNPYNRPYYPQ